LEEQHGAVRRPQQQGVEDGDVDAVMEEFDSDDCLAPGLMEAAVPPWR
jgi:hypothetical protein